MQLSTGKHRYLGLFTPVISDKHATKGACMFSCKECFEEYSVKNPHGTYGQHLLACPKLREKAAKKVVEGLMSPSKKRAAWDGFKEGTPSPAKNTRSKVQPAYEVPLSQQQGVIRNYALHLHTTILL